MADAALDLGQCPACGFPLDGPVILVPAGVGAGSSRLLPATLIFAALAGSGATGYFLLDRPAETPTPVEQEFVELPEPAPVMPVTYVAPYPHAAKQTPEQVDPVVMDDKGQPGDVPPPKRVGPRPVPVVMKVDPKVAAVRHFDHPDDIAALPDLNTPDKVVLTGRVRALRIGSVHGKGSIDASKLIAEEVIITGDLSNEAAVTVNAPGGKVTVMGFVFG
jgi:hypothetical protein